MVGCEEQKEEVQTPIENTVETALIDFKDKVVHILFRGTLWMC